MAPNLTGSSATLLLTETEVIPNHQSISRKSTPKPASQDPSRNTKSYEWDIRWRNVLFFVYLHIGAFYGLYLFLTVKIMFLTHIFTLFLALTSGLGITAGAHRLWSHKSYKANAPLRILLAIFNSCAFQNHVYEWVRDHRVHHKFTDTDADPHNASRGFFFSHIGWLLVRKHPDVKAKGQKIDMSDLEEDWVVMFQKKYYFLLMPLFCFVIPTCVPAYLWGEDAWKAWYVCSLFRYTAVLHGTWSVNSAAHMWGNRPYDKYMPPTENIYVAIAAYGEGWHNYHHAFPWDYKTSEHSGYRTNLTLSFINFFAWLAWAYDLKTVKPEMVAKRASRTGDGSHQSSNEVTPSHHEPTRAESHGHSHRIGGDIWGWDDKDITDKDKEMVEIINPEQENAKL